MTPFKNQKEAIATHLGLDYAEVDWYQPRQGQKVMVYATGNDYFCAVKVGSKATLPEDYEWKKVPSDYVKSRGWEIYQHSEK